jgi:hypothetical protein
MTYETSGDVLFEEVQKHPQWVSWAVRIGVVVWVLVLVISLITEKEKRDLLIGLAIMIPCGMLAIYVNSNVQFEKIVTTNGFYFRNKPLQKRWRVIEKEDIESYAIRKFPFLSYGSGWLPTYGWYHVARSRDGLQLYLKDGRKYFFSTGDKDQFEAAIKNLTSSNPKSGLREF